MFKGLKSSLGLILVLTVLFSSILVVNSEGINNEYKKWNFLADAYAEKQGYPTTNTFKDLKGNSVWSTWVYADNQLTAMKAVSALNGAVPGMWSKDGTSAGAPTIQIRAAEYNMCRVTPAASGTPILRWTSTVTGSFKVTATVMKEAAGGDGTQIVLYKNMSPIETLDVAANDVTTKALSKTVSIQKDETIEVAIFAKANSTSDLSQLNLIIEETDPLLFGAVPQISYTYCGEKVSSIMPNGTVSAALSVENSGAEAANMVGVLAVYTDDNVISGIGFDKIVGLQTGESTIINCNVENYTPEGYTGDFKIKMFVFDTLSGLVPLYKGYSYPPEEKRVWDFEKDNVDMGYPSSVPFGDTYGASEVWDYGMGNHDSASANRPYDFRKMIYDASSNTWYNGEDPKMNVTHNFPYIKINKATGESELQTRSRTAAQQATEGTTNARLHPIVRFVSPLNGEIEINVTLTKKATGGDGVYLMLGSGSTIASENAAFITIGQNAATVTKTKTMTVTKGQCVDFILFGLSSNDTDTSRLSVTITEK